LKGLDSWTMPISPGSESAQRLIWTPRGPGPFESAWSYWVKLLTLNQIPSKTLADQIAINPNDIPLHLNRDGSWIDWDVLSDLTCLERQRWQAGYLDQLLPHLDYRESYSGIRHCPACLLKGYHSVFFELDFVEQCPWHQLPLTRRCRACLDWVRYSPINRTEIIGSTSSSPLRAKGKSTCRHIEYTSDLVRDIHQMSLPEDRVIETFSRALLDWIHQVIRKLPVCAPLFMMDGVVLPERVFERLYGLAASCAGPIAWRINPPERVRLMSCAHSEVVNRDNQHRKESEFGSTYRAIRRYLLHRFIKSHRRCYNRLMHLAGPQTQFLNSDHVCSVSMAFIAWRASIEMHTDLEALRSAREGADHLQSRKFSVETHDFSCNLTSMEFLMARFFELWHDIETLGGCRPFEVHVADNRHVLSNIPLVRTPGRNGSKDISVLYAEPVGLMNSNNVRCLQQITNSEWMLDMGFGINCWEGKFMSEDIYSLQTSFFRAYKVEAGLHRRDVQHLYI
jgi:hypothetical protein